MKQWRSLIFLLLIIPWQAQADLVIDITGGTESALPIAVVPFGGGSNAPEDISAIVRNDLETSGRFIPLADRDLIAQPHEKADVNFKDWRLLRSEGLLIGKVAPVDGNYYEVQFQLFDVYKAEQLVGKRYKVPATGLRRLAHQISDLVYEALTGEQGVFSTRLAFVSVTGSSIDKRYALQVADADGENPRVILKSKQPILSPSWSPDGSRLAYVSFENRHPEIFVQEMRTGQRQSVAAFKGINSAPSWSPDGSRLAVSLSKAGNPEIYVLTLATGKLARITHNPRAIDTEPVWLPSGQELIFTSDRGGRPQIYRVSAEGGKASRITYEGAYNASPDISPDGSKMAMIQGGGGGFSVAVQDLATGVVQVVTDSIRDEAPSFAPNGQTILYATEEQGRGILATVSVDGEIHRRFGGQGQAVREPAWSPFRK